MWIGFQNVCEFEPENALSAIISSITGYLNQNRHITWAVRKNSLFNEMFIYNN